MWEVGFAEYECGTAEVGTARCVLGVCAAETTGIVPVEGR